MLCRSGEFDLTVPSTNLTLSQSVRKLRPWKASQRGLGHPAASDNFRYMKAYPLYILSCLASFVLPDVLRMRKVFVPSVYYNSALLTLNSY